MYHDKKSNFEDLLERNWSSSANHQNIRFLAIEMFKVFKNISLQIVKKIFPTKDAMPYQLKNRHIYKPHLYIVLSMAQKVFWDQNLGNENVREFKKAIKQWKPASFP